jgi:CubicO group peptidase (beta-lactamase class C family)
MPRDFSRIDEPQENLTLRAEDRSQMSDAFAQAHIDYIDSGLLDKKRKLKFLSRLAKGLSVEESELNAAIEDREKLSALFSKLKDEDLVKFNWDKDGLAVIKPADLSTTSIQEYCDNIDFRGVMVVDDGKGNQTKVSNYHKGTQVDPEDHSFATHSVSKLIGGVTICKMIADGTIPQSALDEKLELSDEVRKKLPAAIIAHLETHNVTLRDVMTHHSGLGGYLDPELREGQPGYGTRELGYGVNGYSGYVRQQLEKGEEVEVPSSPQDYLQYAERITYEYGKPKYSDLGIMLASLSVEHHYNKERDPSEHKSFEEIVKEKLTIPAGVEKFSAQRPADAVCHSDDPIAPYITGTAGCGYWTNLDGLVKIGQQIGKMWREDEAFRGVVQNCGQEFYDAEKQVIKHPGGIDSSKTLLSVDLNNGSVVATEERRLGNDFPFPGWGVVTAARNLDKEQSDQKRSEEEPQSFVEKLGLQKSDQEKSFVERMRSDPTKGKSQGGFNEL